MARLIYPSYQGPVLTPQQQSEQVTESRWHQPLSTPRWSRKITTAMIAASGCVFNPLPIPNVVPTADKTLIGLSEPVRQRKRLVTGAQQAFAFAPAAPFPETILWPEWGQQLSEPIVKVKVGLRAAAQQALAYIGAAPFGEVIDLSWMRALEEPVRIKPGLKTQLQPQPVLVQASPFGEVVLVSSWVQPFSLPVWKRPALLTAAQPAGVWNFTPPPPPAPDLGFAPQIYGPVLLRRGLLAAQQQSFPAEVITPLAYNPRFIRQNVLVRARILRNQNRDSS